MFCRAGSPRSATVSLATSKKNPPSHDFYVETHKKYRGKSNDPANRNRNGIKSKKSRWTDRLELVKTGSFRANEDIVNPMVAAP